MKHPQNEDEKVTDGEKQFPETLKKQHLENYYFCSLHILNIWPEQRRFTSYITSQSASRVSRTKARNDSFSLSALSVTREETSAEIKGGKLNTFVFSLFYVMDFPQHGWWRDARHSLPADITDHSGAQSD